ncbi:lipase secretion chaperone [Psychrobacter sp. APC 3426]|uniref:lipase secretion chaperone n=1 Tax=Psychrobacter sp. APC 3426 TaxID=3035177 RepID=UPI0025B5D264|nr:lipase secretion chaperone [Psychrobacter sp. APC 3426]MDN3399205.1 lipase secretion chaperone [Psychrobacter sp. APC 3426]
MSNNRRLPYLPLLIIAIVTAITVAIVMWFKPNKSDTQSSQTDSITLENNQNISTSSDLMTDAEVIVAPNAGNTVFTTGLENLPRSLQGTDVDGEIIIDESRQLVVTEGLRRLFDYFLSALGEENEAVIYARVETYIRSHTPEPAASQAVTIFDQYIAYLKDIPEIEKRYGNLQLQATKSGELDLNAVTQQKQDVSKLRQQYFSKETITAFFGTEDDYDDYSMEMVRINQNTQLSDAQKEAAKQDYISRMPDNTTKANIAQQANLNELMTRTEQMKAKGASPEALYNMRRELVGAPAAARLAQVDQEDANFDQRFDQYQTQKQRLLSQNADKAQAQTQINQLEQQLFNDTERKRLAGYAAMQQQNAAAAQ